MSSVTLAIVSCAFLASGVSTGPSEAPPAATSCTRRQSRRRKRPMPSTPEGRPLHVLVGGTQEEDVEARRVGAVQAYELVGPRDVALRLRHLRAALQHPALVEHPGERLAEAEQAHLVHHLHEEPRVEQVAGRVVDAADVLVDRAPEVDDPPLERRRVRVRIDVAKVVPRGVDERVHRVRLALRGFPHCGHGTFIHSSLEASGATPFGRKSSTSGSRSGSWSSGKGTRPQSSQ